MPRARSSNSGALMPRSITMNASARSRKRRLDALKSSHAKSITIRNRSGCTSSRMLLDSMMTFSLCWRSLCTVVAARGNSPAGVRSQNDRPAPAPKNRPESVRLASYSSLSAKGCCASVGAHSHALPSFEQTPWPYCVIFTAVQLRSRSRRMSPATTDVFPIFRECPPTTTSIFSG